MKSMTTEEKEIVRQVVAAWDQAHIDEPKFNELQYAAFVDHGGIEPLRQLLNNGPPPLQEAIDLLETIVCVVPPDDGVVLLSNDGPCHWDEEAGCEVYNHEHFSPLGDALINLHKKLVSLSKSNPLLPFAERYLEMMEQIKTYGLSHIDLPSLDRAIAELKTILGHPDPDNPLWGEQC